jgi:hypothetical protein
MRVRAAMIFSCLAVAGCGGEAPEEPVGTQPAAAPPEGGGGPAIAIARPADGSRLRATVTPAGRLRLRTRVRGSARAGSLVVLGASCRPARCHARATAGSDGRWEAAMTLVTTRAAPFVTIDAAARASRPGSAVVTIELRAPRADAAVESESGDDRPGASAAPPAAPPPPPPPPPARTLPRAVLVIGDSLAIGMEDSLRAALPGWRVQVDARIGRPLAEGMGILARRRDTPAIIALSLFTNDDPRATRQLADAVRATATRPGGCAVWSTIVRPPYEGVPYTAANDTLERLASERRLAASLQLVDWRAAVAQAPSFIAGDGVHGTPAGYRARGQLYAGAIRACAGR